MNGFLLLTYFTYLTRECATPRVIQQYPLGSTLAYLIPVAQIVRLAGGIELIHRGVRLVPNPAVAAVPVPMETCCGPVAAPRGRLPPQHEYSLRAVDGDPPKTPITSCGNDCQSYPVGCSLGSFDCF